jgi:hypothetical protein
MMAFRTRARPAATCISATTPARPASEPHCTRTRSAAARLDRHLQQVIATCFRHAHTLTGDAAFWSSRPVHTFSMGSTVGPVVGPGIPARKRALKEHVRPAHVWEPRAPLACRCSAALWRCHGQGLTVLPCQLFIFKTPRRSRQILIQPTAAPRAPARRSPALTLRTDPPPRHSSRSIDVEEPWRHHVQP